MADAKTLTVSYGTFACELEGFDDPFPLMKRVVTYYKRLSEQNPEFAQFGEMENVDGLVDAVLNVTGADEIGLTQIAGGVRIVNMDNEASAQAHAQAAAELGHHDEAEADEFEYSQAEPEISDTTEQDAAGPADTDEVDEVATQEQDEPLLVGDEEVDETAELAADTLQDEEVFDTAEEAEAATEEAQPEPLLEGELDAHETAELAEDPAPVSEEATPDTDVDIVSDGTIEEETAEMQPAAPAPAPAPAPESVPEPEVAATVAPEPVEPAQEDVAVQADEPVQVEVSQPDHSEPEMAEAPLTPEPSPVQQEEVAAQIDEETADAAAEPEPENTPLAEEPKKSSLLRLGEDNAEHAAVAAKTFIDEQVGDEPAAPVKTTKTATEATEAPLQLTPEVEAEPEDDLSGTFANAMQRPSAAGPQDTEAAPASAQPEADAPASDALILGDPVQANKEAPAADQAAEPEEESSGRRLGLGGLKVPGLGGLLKSGESKETDQEQAEETNEAAPLQLTPSLKVADEEEGPVKPKTVSETVAERAEENSRRRLRIIRNEEEVAEETEAAAPAEVAAKPEPVAETPKTAEPLQLGEASKPAPVEAVQLVDPEPAAPKPTPAPAVEEPQPLQLAEVASATPAPVEEAPAKPPAAAVAATQPVAQAAEEPAKHDPSNEIANKLQASISAPPQSTSNAALDLASEEFVDDGEMNFRNFVYRLGASTLLELMEAAAVYTTLVENQLTFERKDIMQMVDGVAEGQTFSAQARIKSFGKLVRSGQVLRLEGGEFALAPELQANYQEQMAL